MMGIDNSQSVYLIKPKDYDENQEYPVVFFMHDYGGLETLSRNVEGVGRLHCVKRRYENMVWYLKIKEISRRCFLDRYRFLKKLGYKVNKKGLHIMGLSNVCSASNVAYNNFSKKFKTITYISTGILKPIRFQVKCC